MIILEHQDVRVMKDRVIEISNIKIMLVFQGTLFRKTFHTTIDTTMITGVAEMTVHLRILRSVMTDRFVEILHVLHVCSSRIGKIESDREIGRAHV